MLVASLLLLMLTLLDLLSQWIFVETDLQKQKQKQEVQTFEMSHTQRRKSRSIPLGNASTSNTSGIIFIIYIHIYGFLLIAVSGFSSISCITVVAHDIARQNKMYMCFSLHHTYALAIPLRLLNVCVAINQKMDTTTNETNVKIKIK